MRRTVRVRITVNAVVVLGLAVALASAALLFLLQRSLQHGVDDRASLRLSDIASLVQRGQLPATLAGGDEDGTIAQVVVSGHVVVQSPVIRRRVPLVSFVPPGSRTIVRTVRGTPISDGTVYRVVAETVPTPTGRATVYVAGSLEPVDDSTKALAAMLAVVGPALVLVVGLTTWLLVGRTLDPVEQIRRQVAEISSADLARRVPEPATGDEIQGLVQTMNEMLDRLESSARQQRQFVSDAAHELRSPLATLRTEIDLALTHPEAYDTGLLQRLDAVTLRMSRLAEDLLVLATAEERDEPRHDHVDLDEVVLDRLDSLRATTRLSVVASRIDGARVAGDADQLGRVVTNLLDNAVRHAASTVTVSLSAERGGATLVVADDGPGIPQSDRVRVFERFARVDDARDRTAGGAGLGLSIVRRIVDQHGGSIDVLAAAPGTALVVRLPTEPYAADDEAG